MILQVGLRENMESRVYIGRMFPVSAEKSKRCTGLCANLFGGFQPGQFKPRRTTRLENVLPPCHSPTLSQSGWNHYNASHRSLDDRTGAVGIVCGGSRLRHGNPLSSHGGEHQCNLQPITASSGKYDWDLKVPQVLAPSGKV